MKDTIDTKAGTYSRGSGSNRFKRTRTAPETTETRFTRSIQPWSASGRD